jgi:hypothetical protein
VATLDKVAQALGLEVEEQRWTRAWLPVLRAAMRIASQIVQLVKSISPTPQGTTSGVSRHA